jgi:acetyltransferase-like isoleucine patch superfamily enzyme
MLIQKPRFPIKDIVLYGFLPGFIKKFIYRLKGYKIGKKVSIGLGSVICGDDVSVGDFTSIGFLTVIRGSKICLGDYVTIGSISLIDSPFIEIGDGSRIREQVYVGGLQFPDSRFVLGKNCQVMQMSFLNPTRSIVVGDDSGIGGHCLLFGHTSWLSQFEGYPVDFAPIEIGKSVSIAWGAFLLPGTTVGDGAVVGAQSVVNRSIPERCLAIGFPARVVTKFPDFPKDLAADEKVEIFRNIITEMIMFFRGSGLSCQAEVPVYEITQRAEKFWRVQENTWQFKVADEMLDDDAQPTDTEDLDVFVSLRSIPQKYRQDLSAKNVMWIDIENKERSLHGNDLGDEIIEFFRRYGVRFVRVKT